jgi:hypothetical protein
MEQSTMLMATRSAVYLMATAILICLSQCAPVEAATKEDFGQLGVSREHVKWVSPESMVRDLRAQSEGVRFNALQLVGVLDTLARTPVWSNTTPSVVTGSRVVEPEQIDLRYAALGSDETQQAIVVVQVVGTYAFAAVATPKENGWDRIATFSCWCKYDADSVIDTFVSLIRAPEPYREGVGHFELVLRASGGGTGIYEQNEVHFRLYGGEMKAVISFISRVQAVSEGTPQPPRLSIERRWFYPSLLVNLPDGRSESVAVLAESRGESAVPPAVEFSVRDLQDRYLKPMTCLTFRWNPKVFNYELAPGPDPCKPPGH